HTQTRTHRHTHTHTHSHSHTRRHTHTHMHTSTHIVLLTRASEYQSKHYIIVCLFCILYSGFLQMHSVIDTYAVITGDQKCSHPTLQSKINSASKWLCLDRQAHDPRYA